jgi:hypothetical protein
MSTGPLARAARLVRAYAQGPDPSDGELLTRFIDYGDAAAATAQSFIT